MLIFIEKKTNRIALYGSLKILFQNEKELLKRSLSYFYNCVKLEEADWHNDYCSIHKRTIVRSKHEKFI